MDDLGVPLFLETAIYMFTKMDWVYSPHGSVNASVPIRWTGIIGIFPCLYLYTRLKTNMEPKNGGLENDFPFQVGVF